MTVEKKEEVEIKPPQSDADQAIASKIWNNFLRWRDNRDMGFAYFRGRTCIEYWDDCNKRFNNFRIKPDWKEDWQANTSDTTTHAKLMAIVSQQVVNRYHPFFNPRYSRDMFSMIRAQVFQDIYDFTDGGNGRGTRNGELDTLFTVLNTAKEGTVIGFEGYKKAKDFEGIDSRLIPLEEIYPSDMTKYYMEEQLKLIWRSVINEDEFDEGFNTWYQYDKVRTRSMVNNKETSFFNISDTVDDDQIEILRYFDKLDDEFYITANGILITKPESKLSTRRQDKELGFWKTVFEPYGISFFFGRSLPDLMKDAQDGIDFLFNAMYDKEILAVMRPLLIGGVNQIIDDYNRPGEMVQMADITQIKELDYKGADITAFRVLKELQDRQHFVAVDQVSQGVSIGRKTATEVERAQEAARRISTLLGTFVKDGLVQKARLRAGIIQQYLVKSDKFKNFIMENVKLFRDKTGTRMTRITETPAPADQFGTSKRLQAENLMIKGESEIFEITPKEIADFEFSITTKAPSEIDDRLKKALDIQFYNVASQRPDQFDQTEAAKDFSEAMDKDWEKVKAKEQQPMMPEQGQPKGVPSLQSMIPQI